MVMIAEELFVVISTGLGHLYRFVFRRSASFFRLRFRMAHPASPVRVLNEAYYNGGTAPRILNVNTA
jgi:hypothetical protein